MDQVEGEGIGYDQKDVAVIVQSKNVSGFTYVATDIDETLSPYHWYKAFVLAGAKQHGLPQDYISRIESVRSIPDLDLKRRRENAAILVSYQRDC